MMSLEHRKQGHTFILPACPFPMTSDKYSSYKYRVATDTAITGNGVKETPVQSQSERDKTVAGNESSCERTS
jgi:hypothetical protein